MKMNKGHYPKCKICGNEYLPQSVWGQRQGLSESGLCPACSYTRMVEEPSKKGYFEKEKEEK